MLTYSFLESFEIDGGLIPAAACNFSSSYHDLSTVSKVFYS
jgi:hypothetical protein